MSLIENIKSNKEYVFKLPHQKTNRINTKKCIQTALKLSKLWGFKFYKDAPQRDPLENQNTSIYIG